MTWFRKPQRKFELRQPDMYISPVVKPRDNYSMQEIIDSDARKIVQSIILPSLNKLHAIYPEAKNIEIQLRLSYGCCLEVIPVPYATEVHYVSPPALKIKLASGTLAKVAEIASYYGIHSEKPEGAGYRSFTKELDDDTIFYEKMMAYKNQELEALMEKARAEKAAKEKAEAEEQARINKVLLYEHNCLQALIASVQAAG